MKKIKLACLLLVAIVSTNVVKAAATPMAGLTNFQMVWGFTNPSGSNGEWAWNDVCSGGIIYVKNKSIYGSNWPIPNTLTGTYEVYNAVGNSNGSIIGTIPAANWPYNGVYAFQLPAPGTSGSYFNYSVGLNIRIRYIGSDVATGNRERMNYLTTRALPSVNAGLDQSVCQGGSVQLTGTGASTYTWNPSGSTQATIQVVPSATTTYTLSGSTVYTTANTSMTQSLACSNTDNVTVSILPLPTVKGWVNSYSLCTGATFPNLNAYAGLGSFSYQWSYAPINGVFSTIPVTTSNLNTSSYGFGSYNVLVTNNATGCISSWTTTVSLDPSAAANLNANFLTNDVVNTSAGTVTISPSSSVAGNHVWYLYNSDVNNNQGSLIASFTGSSFNYTLALGGYYLVKHQISKSPCNEVKTLTLAIHYDVFGRMMKQEVKEIENGSNSKLSVNGVERMSDINVFPNPSKGLFTIQLDELNDSNGATIEVYDMTGRMVKKLGLNALTEVVDMQGQPNGTYSLRILNGNKVSVQKIVVLAD